MRRRLVALTLVPFLLFGAAACGGDGEPSDGASASVDMGEKIEGVQVSGPFGKEPKVTVDAPVDVNESVSQVIRSGDGAAVQENKEALLHFTVYNGKTGKRLGSTYDQQVPQKASTQDGNLFPSMLDAIVGKPSGSRILIASTPEQAYGPQGLPDAGLSGKDTVIFVVDVLSTHPGEVLDAPQGEEVEPPKGMPRVVAKNGEVTDVTFEGAPAKAPDELQVIPLIKGEGPPARDDSFVTFDYYGVTWGGKRPFDQSYDREPVPFPVGINGLIQAWDKEIPGLKRGSRVMIIAPPETAYGAQARPGIPANSTLVFVVDILGVD